MIDKKLYVYQVYCFFVKQILFLVAEFLRILLWTTSDQKIPEQWNDGIMVSFYICNRFINCDSLKFGPCR